jgi:hypothetical protein
MFNKAGNYENLLRAFLVIISYRWFHANLNVLALGLVGLSETIPLIDGKLGLPTWQNIFFCEFDGPRSERKIVCTVLGDDCVGDRILSLI